jgi:hypothetical protein
MEKILFNIDSKQRDITLYPNSNFFKIEYNNQIKNINYISIVDIEIINSFYVFNTSRHNVSFTVTSTLVTPPLIGALHYPTGNITVTINNGNYILSDFINKLNLSLNNSNFNIGYTDINNNFIVTEGLVFSVTNNIITLTNLSPYYNCEINFDNNNIDYVSLGYMLGFIQNSYLIKNTEYITGNNFVDITGEKYFFIRVNDYGNTYVNTSKKVLGKIILYSPKNEISYNDNSNQVFKTYIFRQPVDIQKIEIELLDYTGNILNNNGTNFSFTLEVGFIYDEKLYLEHLNNYHINKKYEFQNNIDLKTDTNAYVNYNINPSHVPEFPKIKNKKDKKDKKNKYSFNYI